MILKAHHLLCMNFFIGKGYTDKFTENMQTVIDNLTQNPDIEICIKKSSDLICNHCPNRLGDDCVSKEQVDFYDEQVLKLCHLQVERTYTFDFVKNSVRKNILQTGKLSEICSDCSWFTICMDSSKHYSSSVCDDK